MACRVKARKKRLALPRRQWKINPVTRIKQSAKLYSRARSKLAGHKTDYAE
jgi:hypothetical protein